MRLVTLYGRGAAVFHSGKETFSANNGTLTVPELLVSQALSMGFKRTPDGGVLEEGPDETARLDEMTRVDLPEVGAIAGGDPISSSLEIEKTDDLPPLP